MKSAPAWGEDLLINFILPKIHNGHKSWEETGRGHHDPPNFDLGITVNFGESLTLGPSYFEH